MGFYRQPNDWTCGPFALKHALVAIGCLANERAISKVAHPHWWAGTDEVKLARAARHFDCDLPMIRRMDAEKARTELIRQVGGNQLPVLLCVDEWDHWITVVCHEQDRFVVLDSRHEPVMQVTDWHTLHDRWCYVEEEETEPTPLYDLHPVKPRFRGATKAEFSVKRAQFLRRPENAALARNWDAYLEDLLQLCRPRSVRAPNAMSMAEFLRRNQDLLVSRVLYWHGHIDREQIVRILRNFRFVAETYGLVIPEAGARRALVDLAILLAFWAAANHGVGAMYGTAPRPRKKRRKTTRQTAQSRG